MKNYAIFAMLVAAMLLLTGCVKTPSTGPVFPGKPIGKPGSTPEKVAVPSAAIKSFSSWDDVSDFLRASNPSAGFYGGPMMRGGMMTDALPLGAVAKESAQAPAPSAANGGAADYSTTNVQVAGVDEADIVKNDGKYVYVVGNSYSYYGVGPFSFSGTKGTVKIIDAFPASGMKIASEISFEGNANQIFIYNDKLVVFGSRYEQQVYPADRMPMCMRCIVPPYYSQNFAFMKVYDITDRAAPKLEKEYEVKGNYITSRMIDGKVYGVFSDPVYYNDPIPLYAVDGVAQKIAPSEITYFDWPGNNYNYNIFLSADLNDLSKEETRKIMLMDYAQNLFVSQDNMFVTYTKYDYYYLEWKVFAEVYGDYLPSEAIAKIEAIDASNLSDWRKDKMKMAEISDYAQKMAESIPAEKMQSLQQQYSEKLQAVYDTRAREAEKTAIHKLALDGFVTQGEAAVPGHVLNQFSMDESNGYFRIATTIPRVWNYRGQESIPSTNNLYILDSGMKQVGSVEDIAPGEQIYSVRFMGDRAYMVTFRQIDPFFVLDLSNPSAPKIAGKLKLPGFSNYLHPYDETHIIGLGKETEEGKEGQVFQKGVKLSLFDVSDIANPREVAKYEIGDRGSDSNALYDHKAFLFSKERNLLVIPVLEAKIDPSKYAGGQMPQWQYGDYVFQGAYVFTITADSIGLRGKVTHATEEELLKSGEYYWSAAQVSRSLYMDNVLYTVSDRYVKANDLGTLAPISSVKIGEDNPQYGYPMTAGAASGSGGVAVPETAPAPPAAQ